MNIKTFIAGLLKNRFVQILLPIIAVLLIVLLSVILAKHPDDFSAEQKSGIFISYGQGDMTVSKNGVDWEPATNATVLEEGDRIRTGQDSKIILKTPRGNTLRMDGNTEISASQLSQDSVALSQNSGRTFNIVTTADGIKYQISVLGHTITASSAAQFGVSANIKANRINVKVFKGTVDVSVNIDGATGTQQVSAGKQITVDPNSANIITLSDITEAELTDEWIMWNNSENQKSSSSTDAIIVNENAGTSVQSPTADAVKPKQSTQQKSATCKPSVSAKKDNTYKGILVNWTTCSSEDFQFYKVVRSTLNHNPSFPNDPVVSSSANRSYANFIDKTVAPNNTYYYRVCTVEKINRIACSNVVSVAY